MRRLIPAGNMRTSQDGSEGGAAWDIIDSWTYYHEPVSSSALAVYRAVRWVSAVLLAGAAIFHVSAAAAGGPGAMRHGMFVGINLAMAALLVARPHWAYYPALALAIQQTYSHGLDLSKSFLGTAPLDKVSLAVCLFFPTLVTLLYMERQERRP
jgi:hypothetical protein